MPTAAEPEGDVLLVTSPYAGTRLSGPQHIAISSYWFASNVLWGAMLLIILPSQVEAIASHFLGVLPRALANNPDWYTRWSYEITTDKGKALGIIGSAVAIVSLLVPLIAGAVSDRCMARWGRRRPFMAAGSALSIGALLLMYFAGQAMLMWWFMAAYCLMATGNNIATAAYSGVIPDLVPEDQRGIASGYMAMMSQVGTLVGAFAAGFIGSKHLLGAYLLIIFCIAAFTLLTMLGIQENPLVGKPAKLRWGAYAKSLWIDPRKYPDFAWVWITRFLVMLGFYAVEPFIRYYLHDVIGIADPDKTAAILLAVILVGATFSGMYGGYLSERIGRKKVVYVSNVVIAVMCLLLILCRTLPQALTVGVLFGLGYGAYVSVDWALGTDVLPSKRDAGKDMAVWHISMTLPQSITPLIAGYFLLGAFGSSTFKAASGEMTRSYPASGYALVFGMAALFFLLGAVFLRNVKKAR